MARKKHAADIYNEAQIARAVSFSIYLRKSPTRVLRETASSISDARTIEARMNTEHGRSGPRAAIYAITPEKGSYFIPDHIQE